MTACHNVFLQDIKIFFWHVDFYAKISIILDTRTKNSTTQLTIISMEVYMTYLILHWTPSFLLFRFVLRALFKPISDYILKPFLVSFHNWICVPTCGLSHHLCVLCTHTCSPCLRYWETSQSYRIHLIICHLFFSMDN